MGACPAANASILMKSIPVATLFAEDAAIFVVSPLPLSVNTPFPAALMLLMDEEVPYNILPAIILLMLLELSILLYGLVRRPAVLPEVAAPASDVATTDDSGVAVVLLMTGLTALLSDPFGTVGLARVPSTGWSVVAMDCCAGLTHTELPASASLKLREENSQSVQSDCYNWVDAIS